ncbi:hypothetical protein GN958_ATG06727 [Phytophthora infestans]|uniref:Uncharacterized protein n=1 Tax=Phytophthora infestans TaxID=4787 RepID=A0A8S9U5N3_PHYIN|nr:hypothetical protein GN958_ATG14444 [Phytophthora infestans]KAF4144074.1 hypothetical protein GN958_ATG06727 [Phytophthora infestans]
MQAQHTEKASQRAEDTNSSQASRSPKRKALEEWESEADKQEQQVNSVRKKNRQESKRKLGQCRR